MNSQRVILIIAVLAVLTFLGFWFWPEKKEKGAVETAKDISESVPEIQTNVGEKVPEINPLDRANPFKYTNPLR
jgi:predicted negative regulator of RcsB-dependent stress response